MGRAPLRREHPPAPLADDAEDAEPTHPGPAPRGSEGIPVADHCRCWQAWLELVPRLHRSRAFCRVGPVPNCCWTRQKRSQTWYKAFICDFLEEACEKPSLMGAGIKCGQTPGQSELHRARPLEVASYWARNCLADCNATSFLCHWFIWSADHWRNHQGRSGCTEGKHTVHARRPHKTTPVDQAWSVACYA